MCAIAGSFDTDTLIKLVELNSYRGSHSYSYSVYDPKNGTIEVLKKELGTIDPSIIKLTKGKYGIVHVQAPTTEAQSKESIHPAIAMQRVERESSIKPSSMSLWHNGILKEDCVKALKEASGSKSSWDTMLMVQEILSKGWLSINAFNGSFSCLLHAKDLFLFRNEISPMFIDSDLNISSTNFPGSAPTEPNKVLMFDFEHKTVSPIFTFKTVENPYFFMDEN